MVSVIPQGPGAQAASLVEVQFSEAMQGVGDSAFVVHSALRGALLSFGYCIGLGIPFVAFAFFIERAARATDFIRRHYTWIMRIGGGMLVLVGLLLVTGLWLDFTIWLRVSIPGFETAL